MDNTEFEFGEDLTCKICGKDFEFSQGERVFYESRSLNPPKRCPECRAKKRKEMKSEEKNGKIQGYTSANLA